MYTISREILEKEISQTSHNHNCIKNKNKKTNFYTVNSSVTMHNVSETKGHNNPRASNSIYKNKQNICSAKVFAVISR